MDALHVITGVGLQLLIAAAFREDLRSWRPWLLVLGLELLNELHDLWVEQWPDWGQQFGEGAKDIALTMLLPTALMIVARRWPLLLYASGRVERLAVEDHEH